MHTPHIKQFSIHTYAVQYCTSCCPISFDLLLWEVCYIMDYDASLRESFFCVSLQPNPLQLFFP